MNLKEFQISPTEMKNSNRVLKIMFRKGLCSKGFHFKLLILTAIKITAVYYQMRYLLYYLFRSEPIYYTQEEIKSVSRLDVKYFNILRM